MVCRPGVMKEGTNSPREYIVDLVTDLSVISPSSTSEAGKSRAHGSPRSGTKGTPKEKGAFKEGRKTAAPSGWQAWKGDMKEVASNCFPFAQRPRGRSLPPRNVRSQMHMSGHGEERVTSGDGGGTGSSAISGSSEVPSKETGEAFARRSSGALRDEGSTLGRRHGDPEVQIHLFPEIGSVLCRELRRAEQSIMGTCYCFDFTDGCRVIAERARRPVEVRILLDAHQFSSPSCRSQPARVAEMIQWGVTFRRYSPPRGQYAVMHAKSWLIDGSTLLTGSANFTHNAAGSSEEILTVLRGPGMQECITKYLEWFEGLWALAQEVHSGELV